MSSNPTVALQVRKPYTITKQRERWTEEEHVKFVEALQLFGRGWRKIEEHIGTKTAVQIRSHAQKFFSKVEREKGTAAQHIEIPPPRPKRKPSHPYPKKAGVSSSEDTAAQGCLSSSPSCLDDNTTTTPTSIGKSGVKKGLKLFGKTVLVDELSPDVKDASSCREDESGVESGASDFQRTTCGSEEPKPSEVSSRNQESQDFEHHQHKQRQQHEQQQVPVQPADHQLAMNNLILLHYAAFLAAAHPQVGQVNPWQLLTPQVLKPQQEILRWQSMTDSNSPGAVDQNNWDASQHDKKTDTDETEVQAAPHKKRRRSDPVHEEKSSSSSTTTSVLHGDDEAGSCTQACSKLSTMPSLDSSSRGGFVPYKRPAAMDKVHNVEQK